MTDIIRTPLDVVAYPDDVPGPPTPVLVKWQHDLPFRYDAEQIGMGVAALGLTDVTMQNTMVRLQEGPLPQTEGETLYPIGLCWDFGNGTYRVDVATTSTDRKGRLSQLSEEEINRTFWHEFGHLIAAQDKIVEPSKLLGPAAREKVSRLLGKFSHVILSAGVLAGSIAMPVATVGVSTEVKFIETYYSHNPDHKIALVVGAGALGMALFGWVAKSFSAVVHSFMHSLDPAERFANQVQRDYAPHFKAIRTCED